MAITIPASIIEQYSTLTGPKPDYAWYEYVGITNPDGTAIDLPLLMFYDMGDSQNITFETITTETYNFQFRAFDTTYALSRRIYDTVMFDGQDPADKAGFAYAESFVVPTGYQFEACIPVGQPTTKRVINQRNNQAINVYQTTWNIAFQVQRNA